MQKVKAAFARGESAAEKAAEDPWPKGYRGGGGGSAEDAEEAMWGRVRWPEVEEILRESPGYSWGTIVDQMLDSRDWALWLDWERQQRAASSGSSAGEAPTAWVAVKEGEIRQRDPNSGAVKCESEGAGWVKDHWPSGAS